MQPSHDRVVLCTQIWHDFCAHADLLSQPTCTHSPRWPGKEKEGGRGSSKLLCTPIPVVKEKEILLVKECSNRLSQFRLTLWVVSMNETPKNCDILNEFKFSHGMSDKKLFLNTTFVYHQLFDVHGTVEFLYYQEYDYCTP